LYTDDSRSLSAKFFLLSRSENRVFASSALVVCWYSLCVGSLLFLPPPIFIGGYMVDTESPVQRAIQMSSVIPISVGFILSVSRFHRIVSLFLRDKFSSSALLFTLFGLAVGSFAVLSVNSLLYTALFFGCICCVASVCVDGPSAIRQMLYGVAISSVVFLLTAFALFGPPQGRWVGNIHPNLLGFVAIVPAAITLMLSPRIGAFLAIGCFAAAVAVSSRYSIMIILICYSIAVCIYSTRRFGLALTGSLLLIALPIIVAFVSGYLFDVFELDDPNRGIGTGATGRAELNARFWDQFASNSGLGVGFRNRTGYEYTHNGYLNFALESGLLVSAAFFGLIASCLYRSFAEGIKNVGRNRTVSAIALLLMACALSAMFQPQLVNFGDAQGVIFIISLTLSIVILRRDPTPAFDIARQRP
jgi:hypothetical protein